MLIKQNAYYERTFYFLLLLVLVFFIRFVFNYKFLKLTITKLLDKI